MSEEIKPQEPQFYGPRTSSMAVVSLVLGIASYFVIPLLGGIAAIITGNLAKKEIQQEPQSLSGEGLARAGTILGWVNIGLSIVGTCLVFFFVIMTFVVSIGITLFPLFLIPIFNNGF